MTNHLFEELRKNIFFKFIFSFFCLLSLWWVSITFRGLIDDHENNLFTLIYPLLSLAGGIAGVYYAGKWGGLKSALGRSISMFSYGLLAQFFGQAMYAYYIYIKGIEVPYPSFGDFGYFGSVIFYIFGISFLAKVSGFKFSFKSLMGKLQAFFIPLGLLAFTYLFFLKSYLVNFDDKIKLFLDFGYPLGQAIYVSIAIITVLMARNILGGIMKNPIWFLIFALVVQYFSDFIFLYQSNSGTWYVGGINDYLYFLSYFLMSTALIYMGSMLNKIRES